MPVRRLRNGRFVVELQQSGTRVFRRLHPGASKADAQALEAKLRRDIFTTAKLGIRPEVEIAGAIGLWLEHVAVHHKDAHGARLRSKAWAPHIVDKTLRQAPEVAKGAVALWSAATVTKGSSAVAGICATTGSLDTEPATIASHRMNPAARTIIASPRDTRLRAGHATTVSAGTINRRLALLKAVCKWSYQQGMIDENLSGRIRMLRERPGREVYLSRAQVMRLARCAPTSKTTAAIMIAAYSGLRVSELIALPKQNMRSASLLVPTSKSGKPRIVPLPSPAVSSLRALPLGLSYWQLYKEFCQARKKASMPHVRFHDLRHTCASWLINQGVDLYTVGRILGHSTPLTTQRYAHLSQASLRKAMARLK